MYKCNASGKTFNLKDNEKTREGGSVFGLNSRLRAIIYVLIKHLKDAGFKEITFYDPNIITDMQKNGIFWENKYSLVCSAKKCLKL